MKAFLKYSSIYLCALLLSALGVVLISNPFKDKTAEAAIISTTQEDETAFDKLLNGIMSANGLDVSCDLLINAETENPVQVKANVLLDLSNGMENIALQGDLDASFNAQNIKLDFTYVDNYIYATMLDNKFKINSSNIMDIVKLAMGTSEEKASFASSSLDLGSLDVNQIMYALQNMTDNVTGNGHELSVELFGMQIVIVTDFDYKIKSVQTGEIQLEGISILPNISMNYVAEPQKVVAPVEKHVDLSSASKILASVQNLIADKCANMQASLIYAGKTYNANIKLDFNNSIKLQLATKLMDYDLDLTYVEDTIYANVGPLHVKFNINDVDKLCEALKEFDIDISEYLAIVESVKSFDFSKIDVNNLDFSAISLKVLKDIIENEDNYQIVLDSIGTITLEIENSLSGVSFENDEITANIIFVEEEFAINVPENNYINIADLLKFVPTIADLIKNVNYQGAFNLSYKDFKLDGTYHLIYSKEGGLKVELHTSLYGLSIEAKLINNVVYANVAGLDICFGLNEIPNVINWINTTFKTNIKLDTNINLSQSIPAILGQIKDISTTTTCIEIDLTDGKLALNLLEDIDLSVNYKDISATATLAQTETEITVNAEGYKHFTEYTNLVDNVLKTLSNKQLNMQANIIHAGKTYSTDVKLDFNDSIKLKLTTKLMDYYLDLTYVEDIIYANVGPLHAKFDINDIDKLCEALKEFDIDISEYLAIIDKVRSLDFSKINFNGMYLNKLDLSSISLKVTTSSNEQGTTYVVELNNVATISILINNGVKSVAVSYKTITANITFVEEEFVIVVPENNYINIADLFKFVPTIKQLISNVNYEGSINFAYKDFKLDGTYHLIYSKENGLKAELSTSLYGLAIEAKLVNNVVYANVAGLDICFGLNEISSVISWINTTFKTNIKLDANINLAQSIPALLNSIKNINVTENGIEISIDNGKLVLNLLDDVDLSVSYKDITANATLTQTEKEITVNAEEYKHFTVYTALIENIISTFKNKQVDMTAIAKLTDGETVKLNAECDLELDFNKPFAMFGEVLLKGEQDFEFNLAYDQEMWYLNYNKLKVKMSRESLVEILGIVCNVLGIDTSSIEFLQTATTGESFDVSNLQQIIPSLDFGNPLNMLYLIKSLNFENGVVSVTLDGKAISKNANASDLTIQIVTENNMLNSIVVKDFYTSAETNEKLDLTILFHEFTTVKKLPDIENYMDLSNASGLVRALINTSSLNDFHITANLDINMEVLSINKPITMTVPVDIKVKLIDKKPQIMAEIGPIPVIAPVDNDVPYKTGDTVKGLYCGLNRILKVYYADGFVYFQRSETVPVSRLVSKTDRVYEKMLKITLEEFLADPMMILSYGCGFQDIIMDEIQKAMDLATNRETPMDLSNILLGFEFDGINKYSLTLNLAEIANNPQLDRMTISLSTSEIDGKQYITKGTLDMHMPIADAFKMDLNSHDLELTDIGTELDWTEFNNFVNNYKYKVDEKWEASNGDWKLASATTYTVNFVTNSTQQVADVVDATSTEFELPTLETYVLDDGTTRKTYTFAGWFTSNDFAESTRYTKGVIARGDLTLYAKWDEQIEYYFDINFVNQFLNLTSVHALAGSEFAIDFDYDNVVISTENSTTTYAFAGWFTDAEFSSDWVGIIVPEQNITLFAKWDVISVVETRLLNIFDNDVLVSSTGHVVGKQLVLPTDVHIVESTKWYLDADYSTAFEMPTIMPDTELNLHIRNIYTITIVDNTCGNATRVISGYQGERAVLPTDYATKVVDDGTQTKQDTYTFAGFKQSIEFYKNENTTIEVNWDCETKYYYTITFNKDNNVVSAYKKHIVFPIDSLRVLEGTKVDLAQYVPTWEYSTSKSFHWRHNFKGWSTQKGGSNITEIVVTGDTPIYANWSGTPERVK